MARLDRFKTMRMTGFRVIMKKIFFWIGLEVLLTVHPLLAAPLSGSDSVVHPAVGASVSGLVGGAEQLGSARLGISVMAADLHLELASSWHSLKQACFNHVGIVVPDHEGAELRELLQTHLLAFSHLHHLSPGGFLESVDRRAAGLSPTRVHDGRWEPGGNPEGLRDSTLYPKRGLAPNGPFLTGLIPSLRLLGPHEIHSQILPGFKIHLAAKNRVFSGPPPPSRTFDASGKPAQHLEGDAHAFRAILAFSAVAIPNHE